MTWEIAGAAERACGGCRAPIPGGRPVRRLRHGFWSFCEECAKRCFGEDAPDALEAPLASPPPAPSRPSTTGPGPLAPLVDLARRQLGFDFKRAQSGDTDDH